MTPQHGGWFSFCGWNYWSWILRNKIERLFKNIDQCPSCEGSWFMNDACSCMISILTTSKQTYLFQKFGWKFYSRFLSRRNVHHFPGDKSQWWVCVLLKELSSCHNVFTARTQLPPTARETCQYGGRNAVTVLIMVTLNAHSSLS